MKRIPVTFRQEKPKDCNDPVLVLKKKKKMFRCININARSIVNKTAELESIVTAHKPHVLIITETWLHSDITYSEITPHGYGIYRYDRDSRDGSVAILFQETLSVARLPDIIRIECVMKGFSQRVQSNHRRVLSASKFRHHLL